MFNVYKNQLSRQTGICTFPILTTLNRLYNFQNVFFYTPAPRRGKGVYCFPSVRPSKIFFVAFFSVTIDGRNLIFGHKLHIGTPYRGKRFWTHQIPTSCLPKSGGIISEYQLTVHLVQDNINIVYTCTIPQKYDL